MSPLNSAPHPCWGLASPAPWRAWLEPLGWYSSEALPVTTVAGGGGVSESPGLGETPLEGSMEIKELCLISAGPLRGAREDGFGGRFFFRKAGPRYRFLSLPAQVKVDRCRLCAWDGDNDGLGHLEKVPVLPARRCTASPRGPARHLLPWLHPARSPRPRPLQTHPHAHTHTRGHTHHLPLSWTLRQPTPHIHIPRDLQGLVLNRQQFIFLSWPDVSLHSAYLCTPPWHRSTAN